jgi:hypothetical protein
MKVGDTFLHPLSATTQAHLWIVLTNPDANGSILIVNVTSIYSHDKDRIDPTVILNRNEHRFLTNERSFIYYRGATVMKLSDLQTDEQLGLLKKDQVCSANVISLARAGVTASPHCTPRIQKYYKECKDLT